MLQNHYQNNFFEKLEQYRRHKNAIGVSTAFIIVALLVSFSNIGVAPEERIEQLSSSPDSQKQDYFANLSLSARAAFVWDVNNHEAVFAHNEHVQLPLASLAKLMVALVSAEALGRQAIVSIPKDAIEQEGDTGLLVDEKWRLSDLVNLTLLSSSNDGAFALSSAVARASHKTSLINEETQPDKTLNERTLFNIMNTRARELGLTQTFFINESGLDVNIGVSGAYGSARDTALLVEYILREHSFILEATQYKELIFTSLSDFSHHAKNTNESVESLPGVIASKTGFTELAGGNLVTAFEAGPGHVFIAVVLGSVPIDERENDMSKVIWATLRTLNQ